MKTRTMKRALCLLGILLLVFALLTGCLEAGPGGGNGLFGTRTARGAVVVTVTGLSFLNTLIGLGTEFVGLDPINVDERIPYLSTALAGLGALLKSRWTMNHEANWRVCLKSS